MPSASRIPRRSTDAVGRVDGHGLAGLAVADQVHEVDHLAGHRVVDGEVTPGEQLAEVETVGVHGGQSRGAGGRRRLGRYVVVGCGAVGGLYGARLAAAGHDVGFLARSDVAGAAGRRAAGRVGRRRRPAAGRFVLGGLGPGGAGGGRRGARQPEDHRQRRPAVAPAAAGGAGDDRRRVPERAGHGGGRRRGRAGRRASSAGCASCARPRSGPATSATPTTAR